MFRRIARSTPAGFRCIGSRMFRRQQSVALLATFVPQRELDSNGALNAIAAHADPAADPVLDRYLAPISRNGCAAARHRWKLPSADYTAWRRSRG